MIQVRLRYFDTEINELFSDHETIGFWTWKAFVNHFNRLYRWKIKFELMEINGSCEYTGAHFWEVGIRSTLKDILEIHEGMRHPEFNALELVEYVNGRVRNDYA